jgi:hypothetical protein
MPNPTSRLNARPAFTYRYNALRPRSYDILRLSPDRQGYEPVGLYTALDAGQSQDMAERDITHLILRMNDLAPRGVDVDGLAHARLACEVVDSSMGARDAVRIVFRAQDAGGPSHISAILTIKRGVLGQAARARAGSA